MSTESAINELRKHCQNYSIPDSTVTEYIVKHFPEKIWVEKNILPYVTLRYRDDDTNISKRSLINAIKESLLTNYDEQCLRCILTNFIMNKSEMSKIFIVVIGVELWEKIVTPENIGWIVVYNDEDAQYKFIKLILKTNGTLLYDSIPKNPYFCHSQRILNLKSHVCTNRKAAIILIGIKRFRKIHTQIDRFIFHEIAISLWAEI